MILSILLMAAVEAVLKWKTIPLETFELSFADKCLLISADTRHSERRSTN